MGTKSKDPRQRQARAGGILGSLRGIAPGSKRTREHKVQTRGRSRRVGCEGCGATRTTLFKSVKDEYLCGRCRAAK